MLYPNATSPATAGVPTNDTPVPQARPQAGAGLPSPLEAMTGVQGEKRGCAEGIRRATRPGDRRP